MGWSSSSQSLLSPWITKRSPSTATIRCMTTVFSDVAAVGDDVADRVAVGRPQDREVTGVEPRLHADAVRGDVRRAAAQRERPESQTAASTSAARALMLAALVAAFMAKAPAPGRAGRPIGRPARSEDGLLGPTVRPTPSKSSKVACAGASEQVMGVAVVPAVADGARVRLPTTVAARASLSVMVGRRCPVTSGRSVVEDERVDDASCRWRPVRSGCR